MRTARTILTLTVTATVLSACGGSPGGPDAQHPDPGDCRVTVSSDISSPAVFTNGPETVITSSPAATPCRTTG